MKSKKFKPATFFFILFFLTVISASAQTSAFNFQGRLNDGANPANGRYDLQFKLFDAIMGGNQIGATVDRPNLMLINGVFSTVLDFGAAAFTTSGNRFLEISVRPNGSPNAFVVLGARQQLLSVPLAVRATSATNADNATNAQNAGNSNSLGGITASNYARLNFLNSGNLQTSGNVGFGTVAPNTRLTLSGGPQWTSNLWTASMNMQNGSALGWEANSTGQRFGIGQTDNGLNIFRTISGFGSTLTPAQTDLQITNNGDISQPVERNGVVKAMLAVTANGTIARCYNGVSGSSTGNCGFSVSHPGDPGNYLITFPFQVDNRFWLVSNDRSGAVGAPDILNANVTYGQGGVQLFVKTFRNGSIEDQPFHLFVY